MLMALLVSSFVSAQNTSGGNFTVTGQVVDSITKETVPFTTMKIAKASNPAKNVALLACDLDGKFTVSLPSSGKYIVLLQSIGKKDATQTFTIPAGKRSVNVGELFMVDDNQILGEVVVAAQKPLVKVDIDKIEYSMAEDPEAKSSNTLEMLRKVPMVTVDGDDNIQLQGSSDFKIYLNGKPSNLLSGSNASDVLKSIPASSIKNIEVITDPGAKYDAEGVGGIINIITESNSLDGITGTIRANAGTLGSYGGGGYISAKKGKFGITANYGINMRNSPWSESYSIRETQGETGMNVMNENGRSKNKGPMQFGNLEASFELDTFNLFSVAVDLFRGHMTNTSELLADGTGAYIEGLPTTYNRYSESTNTFGSTDVSFDYQHSSRLEDELLTFSYRFSRNPSDNESETFLENVLNYPQADEYPKWNINDAATIEHMLQLDYTRPTWTGQSFEVGAKYSNRKSESTTLEQAFDSTRNSWIDISDLNSDFVHTQHIYAAYAGYSVKIKNFGGKVGVRAEGTSLKAEYRKDPSQNFSESFFNVVPTLAFSYKIGESQQIRFGYNLRIRRPSIRYLNPYIDDSNPQNISQGNPNLSTEKSHNVRLNYSLFTQTFNANINMNYRFVNNSIESYTFIADYDEDDPLSVYNGALWNTYGNMGKRKQFGIFVNANWNPISWFRIFCNSSADYTNIRSESMDMSNKGWSGRVFLGTQFTLPKDFRINVDGGYFTPRISLQGDNSSFYFTGFRISKDLLKKKLTLSLAAQNPFWKEIKRESTTYGDGFHYLSANMRPAREFRFSISYTFGSFKGKIKSVKRNNQDDDSSRSESSGMEGM